MTQKDFIDQYVVRPNVVVVLIIFALSIASFFIFNPGSFSGNDPGAGTIYPAKVLEILSERQPEESDMIVVTSKTIQEVSAEANIDGQVRQFVVVNDLNPLRAGDKIFVRVSQFEGSEPSYQMASVARSQGIIWLTLFFSVLVIATTGKKALGAFAGLALSFAIIFTFIMPQILSGQNPIIISLIGAMFILLGTLYLSYGFNKKSISALIGITSTLFFVGVLSMLLVNGLSFTGTAAEESAFLIMIAKNEINLVGLLIAGMIIAAIGVLDDISITQASVVSELLSTDPDLSRKELFKKAMVLGRDHISAVVNTLILAYTGASLPLLLLFYMGDFPAGYAVSNELIAEEIVRTLVASSGLVLAVPITTLVAVWLFNKTDARNPHFGHGHAHHHH